MEIFNYLTKLPLDATIKNSQILKDYNLISLDAPILKQRLFSHCGHNDCIIKAPAPSSLSSSSSKLPELIYID